MKSSVLRHVASLSAMALATQACLSCAANVGLEEDEALGVVEQPVMFGDVTWHEYGEFASGSKERRWADAVGFMANGSSISCDGEECTYGFFYEIENFNGGTRDAPLCSGEVGAEQPLMAPGPSLLEGCSVFLVGPKLVATAGHCLSNQALTDCSFIKVMFGVNVVGGEPAYVLPPSDIYTCSKVVTRSGTTLPSDYALFELDRPVTGRVPLFIRRSGAPGVGSALTSISHPFGLPQKIDLAGVVKATTVTTLTHTSDTQKGSSGSPLLNPLTGVVEAVHTTAPPNTDSILFLVFNPGTTRECLGWFPCDDVDGCPQFNSGQLTSALQRHVPLHPAAIAAVL